MGYMLMHEIDEVLSRLTERHQVALRWFVTHLGEERAWFRVLTDAALVASGTKSDYKDGGST